MMELNVYYLDKADEAREMWKLIKETLRGKQNPTVLVDLTRYERTFIAKDVRTVFKEHLEYFKSIDKTAFIVNNPAIRMVVKATMVAIDTRKTCGYFKTPGEALGWLR